MKIEFVDGSEIGKSCPKCREQGRGEVKLIIKTARRTGEQFVGCPNWPKCDQSEEIPQELYMRASGQPSLF